MENNVEVTSMTQCASRPRKPRPSQPSDGNHVDVGPGGRPDQGDLQPNRVRALPKPARDPRLRQPRAQLRFFQIETPTRAPSRTPIAVP